MSNPIRVLVADDSAFMRKILTDLLQSDPGIQVIETARDGQDAVEKCCRLRPHVVTLDLEMPLLNGLEALRQIMTRCPTPVVMVSALTVEGARETIQALSLGAVDVLAKPSGTISVDMGLVRDDLIRKVRAAASATPRFSAVLSRSKPAASESKPLRSDSGRPQHLVVIGCSTGGPGALHQILPRLPANLPAAVLVVQHMPAGFTRSLAQRLDEISAVRVKEAEEGDALHTGEVLVAPGGYHMIVTPEGTVHLSLDPPVHGVRPAVDKTLESAAPLWRTRMVGVILTGMGYDGARGMLEVKRLGGRTIVEDARTCIVYGMPRVVVETGAADQILPVQSIAQAIIRAVEG